MSIKINKKRSWKLKKNVLIHIPLTPLSGYDFVRTRFSVYQVCENSVCLAWLVRWKALEGTHVSWALASLICVVRCLPLLVVLQQLTQTFLASHATPTSNTLADLPAPPPPTLLIQYVSHAPKLSVF